jgi:predicted RNA-binding Zn-ribbon protein involved in translation (DUF1610 family)
MSTKSPNGLLVKFRQAEDKQFCPECGGRMTEVNRCNENGALFVWYQCSRDNCDGQWLQKMPR